MKRNIAALAVIASLATGSLATSANAMGTELNMLTGAIFNELVSRNIATDNIQELTISQLAQIKDILENDDSEGRKTQDIKAIVNR